MNEPPILDGEMVATIAEAVAIAVRPHLAERAGNQRIYEVLNGLGSVAAFVIAGTEDAASHLRTFFLKVVDDELEGLKTQELPACQSTRQH